MSDEMNSLRVELIRLYPSSPLERLYLFLKMRIIPFEEFSAIMPRTGLIVDVGCGYGYIANYLALASSDRTVVGLDPNTKRLELCERTVGNRTNVRFAADDIRKCDLFPADGVLMADVLHHVPYAEQEEVLRGIHRVMRAGGIFLMRETRMSFSIRYFLFNYCLELLLYPMTEKLKFRKDHEWTHLLETVGFRIVRIIPNQGSFPYVCSSFICQKQ